MTYIKVKVYPDAKKDEIKKLKDSHFEIRTVAKAQNNQANRRICQILQKYFKNPAGGVKILNGHQSQTKLIKIGND